jgi:ParB-like chromosome segregation protein Spo0J
MIDPNLLNPAEYNPRHWEESAEKDLTESILRFGLVDPIIVNKAKGRENIVIGGHFRLHIAKKLRFETVPVYYLDIPDISKEQELNLRLNKNSGEWDWNMLANIDDEILKDSGFTTEEMEKHFGTGAITDHGEGCARCNDLHKAIRGHIHSSGHTLKEIVGEIADMKDEE